MEILIPNRRDDLPSNLIKTSKYNIINFLPKALLIQFLRIANIYFLVTAVLQSIPLISPLAPFSAISPLALVMFVSLLREFIEDYVWIKKYFLFSEDIQMILKQITLRHCVSRIASLQQQSGWILKQVTQLESRRISLYPQISQSQNQAMKTRCVMSKPQISMGERNLKTKFSVKGMPNDPNQLKGKLKCDLPNNRIHQFNGTLILEGEEINVGSQNLLLRGTTLKNTKWVIGLVVYTGHNCKIMQSQGQQRQKTTHIEKVTNLIVILILVLQAASCCLLAFLSAYSIINDGDQASYSYLLYGQKLSQSERGVLTYFAFFLLLNTMVPISLIISLETLKFFQTAFMEVDEKMKETNGQKFKALNTMIHEELGRVEYIFTDKTGTLTSNNMVFRGCCIKGIMYTEELMNEIFQSENLMNDPDMKEFVDFWLCVVICHEVLIDDRDESYQGSSPDEVALVNAASKLGFKFLKRTSNSIFIKVKNQMLIFEILVQLDFTSERKRMSIVVKDLQTDRVIIYTKGADNMIWKLLDRAVQTELSLQLLQFGLKNYSKEGLRTLCLCSKIIDLESVDDKIKEYKILKSIGDKDVNEKMIEIENQIEQNIKILGISALEDKLQDKVPETIQALHIGGIKIWMLTGDKLETAENIGHLCNLLDRNTKIFRVRAETNVLDKFKRISKKMQIYEKILKKPQSQKKDAMLQRQLEILRDSSSINSQIRSVQHRIQNDLSQKSQKSTSHKEQVKRQYALVIEGDSINGIINCKEVQVEFLKLIPKFRTVICSRSTPSQKSEIVAFVKKHIKAVTLAIGDGGNDVNMIQEAHIGVGILGKEGNQAAMWSDYFFCEFKYLWRLLFVHGRWNFYRTAYFVNFFFFKNIVFTFQQFFFAFFSAYSAQTFWDDGYLLCYNTLITAVAPVYYGTFDQDLPHNDEQVSSKLPKIYNKFKNYRLFGWVKFAKWYVIGLCCSALIFFVTIEFYKDGIIDQSGRTTDLWQFSITCFWSTVLISYMVIVTDSNQYTYLSFVAYFFLSFILFFPVFTFVWNEFKGNVHHMVFDWIGNIKFYLVIILISVGVFILKHLVNVWQYFEYPTVVQKVQKDLRKKKKAKTNAIYSEESVIELNSGDDQQQQL